MRTLRAKRREVFRIQIAEGVQEKGRLDEILSMAKERKIPIERAASSAAGQGSSKPSGPGGGSRWLFL